MRTTSLALPFVFSGCAGRVQSGRAAAEFVSVHQPRLLRHGRPYRFIGANFVPAIVLGDPKLPGGRARLRREVAALASLGVTNLRVLALSEGASTAGQRRVVPAPGQWDEDLLAGLDFTLAELARRGMTAVLYLTNYWEWSGGMAVYVHWATGEPIPDPNAPGRKHTGADHMNFAARFYELPEAQHLYRQHVAKLLERRNQINGRRYVDDPTIMAWQLANEPRPGTDDPASELRLPAFYQWIAETAQFIKPRAPRQLVSTGSEGTIGCLGKTDACWQAHASPAIDYVTLHLWVKNWGWLTEPWLGPQYEAAVARALEHVRLHQDLAVKLGKPLIMEEFGIGRDRESTDPTSPTTMRDDYYRRMFQHLVNSVGADQPFQAANFWLWSGEPDRPAARRTAGGNSTPPVPVDLNAVLATDRNTRQVIREYNARLAALPD